jgi:ketosteroid isomerase-like protein
MSQENVEIVRTLYESLNDRDWDRFREVCDPDVELRGTIGGLEEDRLIRGAEGIRALTEEEDTEIWDEHLVEPRKLIDAGEQVVVLQREYDRGKSSGVELVVDMAAVVDLRDGRVVRVQPYMDAAAALEAVGLSEQDAQAES